MDQGIFQLGFFMASGLPYLARIVKTSREVPELDPPINDFIKQNARLNIHITIDKEFINISYKDIFICRVNVNDYS